MTNHSSILAWETPWTGGPVGYSPLGHKELDTTEQLIHTHGIIFKSLYISNPHLHLFSLIAH